MNNPLLISICKEDLQVTTLLYIIMVEQNIRLYW